mmetsp:Transcript_33994/g.101548  ORF Transcript_33994/g.101548 Transcript_33994/m.101548 type:complete len:85 (+) Transcript_33994:68-322(+)
MKTCIKQHLSLSVPPPLLSYSIESAKTALTPTTALTARILPLSSFPPPPLGMLNQPAYYWNSPDWPPCSGRSSIRRSKSSRTMV